VILLARAVAALVSFLLLVVLAAAGILAAVFCIGTGRTGLSLAGLADLLHLPALRDAVGGWLADLEAPGAVAGVAALCGLGAILLGLLLLAGLLVRRRERLVTLSSDDHGTLAARRRPLSQAATALVEQARGVTEAKVRVKPRRTTGGRLEVRAGRPRPAEAAAVQAAVQDQLRTLTEPFKLSTRVTVQRGDTRVQ
jgi:nucleoid-associated protein YgaU